jgi:polyhydroxyalkanoate synthase
MDVNVTRRSAPRPFGLHLSIAATAWLSSLAALPRSKNGSPDSNATWPPALASLAEQLRDVEPDALARAVEREARRRLAGFATGIERYRAHPFRRVAAQAPEVFREGTTRVLDYAPMSSGPPILVVPSLINRAYILDLLPERSFVRALAAGGFRPWLVDWDRPGDVERGFGLDEYVAGRLARILTVMNEQCGRSAIVVGYCMGGLLGMPLALIAPERVQGLVLLATPWDFHAERREHARALAAAGRAWAPLIDQLGEMPVDALQALFASLDPLFAARKFRGFAELPEDSPRVREFVALEDWLNDGVPLAAAVARTCLIDWYGENATATGGWCVGGRAIHAEAIATPTLVVAPDQDRIVPPASARPLATLIPGASAMSAAALGHIGMVSSARAPATLWPRIFDWFDTAARVKTAGSGRS